MSLRRPILVCEYLLADPVAWQTASSSMQCEAAAMLTAIVQDLNQLSDVRPVVLLSSLSADMLSSSGRIDAKIEIIITDHGPSEWLRNPSHAPSSFDATLIIAPECGQILTTLLKQIQTDHWKDIRSLNVPWPMAELFSDKYATYQWLQHRGIATPVTKTLDNESVDRLCSSMPLRRRGSRPDDYGDDLPFDDLSVIKPRDGVGCDRVQPIRMRRHRLDRQPLFRCVDDPWIVQEFLMGADCSVGLIGGGPVQPTRILPAAGQVIRMDFKTIRYYGGYIPCEDRIIPREQRKAPAIAEMAQQLAMELGSFSGYVGVDVVVTRDEKKRFTVHVIEINPRFCTSYVGYRALAQDNLAAVLLGQAFDQPFRWDSGAVRFDSAGNVKMFDHL